MDIASVARSLREGKNGVETLINELLARIEALDGALGAFVTIDREGALAAARRVDQERSMGLARGPLHGVPFGAKDLLATKDLPTQVGMEVFEGRMTGYDATTVSRLKAAGAILIGKLAQTEGTFSGYRTGVTIPKNPWNAEISPGASSSGSAVAVAARLCPVALASDTGGSIRVPAAACGVTGLMPSHGRVSRHGAFPLAPTIDRIGPFATSALDCAHVLNAIAGADHEDPASLDEAVPDYARELGSSLRGMRLGFDDRIFAMVDPEIGAVLSDTLDWFALAGARIVSKQMPEARKALEGWVAITAVGAAEAHREYYASNSRRYGKRLSDLVELGLRTSGSEMSRAIAHQIDLTGALRNIHCDIDALLIPVGISQTPSASAFANIRPIMESYPDSGLFTGTYSLAGLPTITFPAGFTTVGIPIGLQLAGKWFDEQTLLHMAHRFQQSTEWHLRAPPDC